MQGLDLSKEEARMKAASRVAPPPPEKVAANLNRALLSGLDQGGGEYPPPTSLLPIPCRTASRILRD